MNHLKRNMREGAWPLGERRDLLDEQVAVLVITFILYILHRAGSLGGREDLRHRHLHGASPHSRSIYRTKSPRFHISGLHLGSILEYLYGGVRPWSKGKNLMTTGIWVWGEEMEKRLRSRPIANNCYSRSGNLEAPTWRERDMRWSFSNSALCGNHAPKARLPLPINGNRNVGYSKSKREDKK